MNKGFTLIELIIYIGIVTAILLVIFNFAWEVIYGNIKSQAIREVQQNARFSMEIIARTIKEAKAINSPNLGSSANSLSLEMTDSNLNPTVFDVSDNKLRIAQGANNPYELTNDRVIVSNLLFANLSYENTPGTIKIEISINHVNPTGRSEYQASFGLKSTISLVPGGAAPSEEGYCQGTPITCGNFGDQISCENQSGCSWDYGSCGGRCINCKDLGFNQCLSQEGCEWDLGRLKCRGKCTRCDAYSVQEGCESQLGCSWMIGYCFGTVDPCENFTTQVTCTSQDGCQWVTL